MVYRLCYLDYNKAYFTSKWDEQWGDDWDDAPYEHNADRPYTHYHIDGVEYEIKLKELYFDLNKYVTHPCDGYVNSPYSVEDINKKACPWLIIHYYEDSKEKREFVFAGTTYTEFIRIIEKYGGVVYTRKRSKNES